jgi:hypothetical protein
MPSACVRSVPAPVPTGAVNDRDLRRLSGFSGRMLTGSTPTGIWLSHKPSMSSRPPFGLVPAAVGLGSLPTA